MVAGATVQVTNGPDGLGHALGSVKKMAALATAGAHSFAIRSLATRITRNVPSKDKRGELAALYCWVRDHIRYREDPRGLEWIQAPERTVSERAGDCDDMATLLSALAQSIGYRVMYRTVGRSVSNQSHVSMEAQCEGQWVSLDPVLEPQRATTRPSASLGAFGKRAPGAAIYYSETGQPMAGLRGTGGGALWAQTPFERGVTGAPIGPTAYRSAGAAGGGQYQSLAPIWRNPFDRSDLGAAARALVRDFSAAGDFGWASLTPAQRRAAGNVQKWWASLGKDQRVRSRATFAAMKAVRPNDTLPAVAAWWQGISSDSRQRLREKYTRGYGDDVFSDITGAVQSVVSTVAPVVSNVVKAIPVYGTIVAAGVDSAAAVIKRGKPLELAAMVVSPGAADLIQTVRKVQTPEGRKQAAAQVMNAAQTAVAQGKMPMVPRAALPANAVPLARALTSKAGPMSAAEVANVLSSRARRVVPQRTTVQWGQLSGVSLNWSLSGPAEASAAAAAASAVSTFISRNGKPPQIAVAAVRAMQQAIKGLVVDGLWGNNSRAAAAWALGKSVASMPAVAAPWAGKPVTWTPPTAAAPVAAVTATPVQPTPAPKPRPVQALPAPAPSPTPAPRPASLPVVGYEGQNPIVNGVNVVRRRYAQAAVDAVRAFIKKHGKPPAVAVAAVREYQKNTPPLVTEGLWGDLTRAAAARDLGVNVSTLPAVAPAFRAKPTATATPQPSSKPKPKPPVQKPPIVTVGPAVLTPTSPTPQSAPAATRKQLARKAVDAVASFIKKKGKPPQIAVAAVRAYQVAAPPLNAEGLWGDATRNSAAKDLGVNVSTLPPVAPAFKAKPQGSTPVVAVQQQGSSSPIYVPVTPTPSPTQPVVINNTSSSSMPSGSPFEPPPAPPEPSPYPTPPAPPEPAVTSAPSSSNGTAIIIGLGLLAMSRRKRRAA